MDRLKTSLHSYKSNNEKKTIKLKFLYKSFALIMTFFIETTS